jgi:hypothetical protein
VAYKLDLPESSRVYPVFHVSHLKQAVGSKFPVTPVVPDGLLHMQVPEQVLQRHLVARGKKFVMQVLVRWSSLPESLATWEDLDAIKQRFPAAPAWGRPASKEGGSVKKATRQRRRQRKKWARKLNPGSWAGTGPDTSGGPTGVSPVQNG